MHRSCIRVACPFFVHGSCTLRHALPSLPGPRWPGPRRLARRLHVQLLRVGCELCTRAMDTLLCLAVSIIAYTAFVCLVTCLGLAMRPGQVPAVSGPCTPRLSAACTITRPPPRAMRFNNSSHTALCQLLLLLVSLRCPCCLQNVCFAFVLGGLDDFYARLSAWICYST